MSPIARSSGVVVLLRDRDGGEVRVGRDGYPVVRYRLSGFDRVHLRAGVEGAVRLLEAAGARAIWTAHARWSLYRPAGVTARDSFMATCDATGRGAGQCELSSLHLMGSGPLGPLPQRPAC